MHRRPVHSWSANAPVTLLLLRTGNFHGTRHLPAGCLVRRGWLVACISSRRHAIERGALPRVGAGNESGDASTRRARGSDAERRASNECGHAKHQASNECEANDGRNRRAAMRWCGTTGVRRIRQWCGSGSPPRSPGGSRPHPAASASLRRLGLLSVPAVRLRRPRSSRLASTAVCALSRGVMEGPHPTASASLRRLGLLGAGTLASPSVPSAPGRLRFPLEWR